MTSAAWPHPKFSHRSQLYCAIALIFAQGGSHAADTSGQLDEVIVIANRPTTVGKLDVALRDQPMNVSVITAEILDNFGKPRLEDVAYSTVGIQPVAPSQGVTNYGFFMRGFNGAPVVVDGYYSSVNAFGSVLVQDLATIESVEVLRGPASLLYGQGNPGGVINLTSKRPRDAFAATIEALADEHGARRVEADVTGPVVENASARVVGVFEDSELFRDFIDQKRRLIAPSFLWHIAETVDLKLHYTYDRLEYDTDNGPGNNPDLIARLPVERSIGEPALLPTVEVNNTLRTEIDWRIADEWTIRAAYFSHRKRLPGGSREIDADVTASGTTIFRTYNEITSEKNRADDYMATLQLLGRFSTGPVQHNLTAAMDYIDQRTRYDYYFTEFASIDYANPTYLLGPIEPGSLIAADEGAFRSYVRAGYVQDLVDLGDKWKVLAGLRRDDITTVGYDDAAGTARASTSAEHALTPRFGAVYQPNSTTTVYASYSEAFVPLIGFDRFGSPYKPEESRAYELGARKQFGASVMLTAAAFDIEKSNIIVVDPIDTNFNINAGVARSQGFELELGGRMTDAWRINIGVAYTDARITQSTDAYFPEGDTLPAAARWSALINTQYSLGGALHGLRVGMNAAYTGERPYLIPNVDPATSIRNPELRAYARIDLFAVYAFNDSLELQINANNLSNERILLANGYGRAQFDSPRTVSLTVRHQLGALR